jgi:hypothetical protein
MNVLISWSGQRARELARILSEWLPHVLPASRPELVSEDHLLSPYWLPSSVSDFVGARPFVICGLPDTILVPSFHFQIGLITGWTGWPSVYPFLAGVGRDAVPEYLTRSFRCVFAEKESVLEWLRDLNRGLDHQQTDAILLGLFSRYWPWLERQVAQIVRMDTPVSGQQGIASAAGNGSSVREGLEVAPTRLPSLSDEATTLLLEAVKDHHGIVQSVETFTGTHIRTGGKEFVESGNTRSEVVWWTAIWDLVHNGLLESTGPENTTFKVTRRGYQVASLLRQQQPH